MRMIPRTLTFAAALAAGGVGGAGGVDGVGGAAAQAPAADLATRFVVAADGNQARYLVQEQLAGFDLPNDAIGVTSDIEGMVTVDAAGQPVAEGSRIVVDLASLTSDADRRDNYIRRRTLNVADHPVAVLVPREVRGLEGPFPATGAVTFQLVGDLTIREVTRTVVWDVTARRDGAALTGTASTRFTFSTFGLEIPRVGRVLSVEDDIRLEYDFRLIPE